MTPLLAVIRNFKNITDQRQHGVRLKYTLDQSIWVPDMDPPLLAENDIMALNLSFLSSKTQAIYLNLRLLCI